MLVWLTGLATYSLSPAVLWVCSDCAQIRRYDLTNTNSNFTTGTLFPTLLDSLINAVSLGLLIFTTTPVTGGHINPLITISTFFGQLVTFPHAVAYILCQIIGATIATFLIHAMLSREHGFNDAIPGCWIDPSAITAGEAVILEMMICVTLIFIVYGASLNPWWGALYSPVVRPILIGLTLGLCTFVTAALKPGYIGAGVHPARCFRLMAVEGRWHLHWVHWLGPVIAGALNTAIHWTMPPGKLRKAWEHWEVWTSLLGCKYSLFNMLML